MAKLNSMQLPCMPNDDAGGGGAGACTWLDNFALNMREQAAIRLTVGKRFDGCLAALAEREQQSHAQVVRQQPKRIRNRFDHRPASLDLSSGE
jgi:hypothetical protein